ncbi:hypothetical protein ACJJTC_007793 [Scirpophaga incertulas]
MSTKCLSNKQISALKATPSLEWACLQCQAESPRRTSSITLPDPDDEDDDNGETPIQINSEKLLSNISKEVEKALKKEMKELYESLQFNSAKLDEVVKCMDEFKKTIKMLQRKNIELTNKNTNLETRVSGLVQRVQEMEQEKLSSYIKLANVRAGSSEELEQVVANVAIKLDQPKEGVMSVRQIHGKSAQIHKVLVELRDEATQGKWTTAARKTKLQFQLSIQT